MTEQNNNTPSTSTNEDLKLDSLLTFKLGMTQFVDEKGEMIPCTVLKYEPMTVAQVKVDAKEGYSALQLACVPKKQKRVRASEKAHFKAAGLQSGARWVTEVRGKVENAAVGAKVSINSFAKGDYVQATARSKGKGFAGAVKRWNSGGGPAAHGSCFHRQPGSSGNRTWPGRIMKGKHFPGHLGDEITTVKNLRVLDVISDDGLIIVNGCVPGTKNAAVSLNKL